MAPKNILMIGPTGVGKTEIARRLARLAQSPFLKVEASKFTEVGYVGRDVESMVRDLVEIAVKMVREEREAEVREKARQAAEERLLDLLLPPARAPSPFGEASTDAADGARAQATTRERLREQLRAGRLDDKTVEIEVARARRCRRSSSFRASSVEEIGVNLRDMLPGMFQGRTRRRKLPVPEAFEHLTQEEAQKLIDMDAVSRARDRRASSRRRHHLPRRDRQDRRPRGRAGPRRQPRGRAARHPADRRGHDGQHEVRHGPTDHILFIAAGAFHVSKPSDLIPELQGRFPIRVELEALGRDEFVRILTEPKNALIKQYTALMATEGVHARVHAADAIERIAELATWSTSAPRTSARGGCTPSWSGCSTRCRSTRPSSAASRLRSTRRTWIACSRTSRRATICRATSCDRRAPTGLAGRRGLLASRPPPACGKGRSAAAAAADSRGRRRLVDRTRPATVIAALRGARRQPRRSTAAGGRSRRHLCADAGRRCGARPVRRDAGRAGQSRRHVRSDSPDDAAETPDRRPIHASRGRRGQPRSSIPTTTFVDPRRAGETSRPLRYYAAVADRRPSPQPRVGRS